MSCAADKKSRATVREACGLQRQVPGSSGHFHRRQLLLTLLCMTSASKLTIGIVLADDTLGVLHYPAVAEKAIDERWLKAPFATLATSDDDLAGTNEE